MPGELQVRSISETRTCLDFAEREELVTRSWAEHTAWGAAALLSGREAEWLGTMQASRLRSTLRGTSDVDDLLPRMRDRAQVHVFAAHRAALPRLRQHIASTDLQLLQVSDASRKRVDGYLPECDLDHLVRSLGLRADAAGDVVLRTTSFDFDRVRDLVTTTRTAAALDAATSTDARLRGVGHRVLSELLEAYR